jgi:hypothetical protein
MSLNDILQKINYDLNGSTLSIQEEIFLKEKLPRQLIQSWFLNLLKKFPLIGVCFSLSENDDMSELGVELKWLTPDQIVEEALFSYPGKSVLKYGYLPIGACLLGSGDPYFLKMTENSEESALVRIPHNFASENNNYPEDKIELVSISLSKFFSKAMITK